jgi:CubicO group peptidase (beta-lactamase class C family)
MKPVLTASLLVTLTLALALEGRAGELPLAKPAEVGLSSQKLEAVKKVVQEAVDKNQTAGVLVLVARHGKVVMLESFGNMDIEAKKAMRPDAIFRIYSMTKPVTSAAAMVLYDEGRFKLDDPVAQYLPELKDLRVHAGKGDETVEVKRAVTIRDLLRHTSGLTYGFISSTPVDMLYRSNKIGDASETLAEFAGKLGKLPLLYQPGTRFNYSYSTDVLARLVEVASGKSFDEFLQERIFKPLDMKDTGFFVPDDKIDRFAATYGPGENGQLKVTDGPATSPYRKQRKFLSGGGGLVSTARDYLRFSQMLLNGGELDGKRLLRKETVQEMTKNQLPAEALPITLANFPMPGVGFGLGFSVRLDTNSEKPAPYAGEYGWSGAASTHFWICPRQDFIVIVMQQYMPFSLRMELALKPLIYAAIEE